MLRNTRLIGALLMPLIAAPVSAWSYDLSYTMINNTNQPIVQIWSSRTSESTLHASSGVYVAANGGRQQQSYNRSATGEDCFYDIRVKFQGGRQADITHINLCSTRTITMDVDNGGQITYASE